MKQSSQPSTAKDVFWYLLMISMLYASIMSFLTIVWQSINIWYPDVISFSYVNSAEMILQSMATILITWPVLLFMSWLINRDLRAVPAKQHLAVRRWLMNLTLFVSTVTIVIDLVNLTNSFFQGELTARFFSKLFLY